MSKTARIHIGTSKITSDGYFEILEFLEYKGWKTSYAGIITYMVNETYDWINEPVENVESIFRLIRESINQEKACFIQLQWENGPEQIEFFYYNSSEICFNIVGEEKMTEDVNFVDYTWYFERLAGLSDVIKINRVACVLD